MINIHYLAVPLYYSYSITVYDFKEPSFCITWESLFQSYLRLLLPANTQIISNSRIGTARNGATCTGSI